MSPRWLHWPAAGSSYDVEISGTTDAADGGGSVDNNPSTAPSLPVTGITLRGTSDATPGRVIVRFGSTADRDTFYSALPNGSSLDVIVGGTTYTNSSITWVFGATLLYLDSTTFDAWFTTSPVGTSYTVRGTL